MRREGAGRADRLELSEDARALADLIRRAAEAPDDPARAQRVEEIRRRIESGTYHVPAEDIARQMLSRILGDGASRRLGDHGH